jgi:ADP-ribose pyrophosphatase
MTDQDRQARRLAAYDDLRRARPAMFANPPDAPVEILFDRTAQLEAAAASVRDQRARGLPAEYGDVGVVYADRYLTLVKDAVRFPSGRIGTYIRTAAADDGTAAVVMPILADGRIVVMRHFRHASREWLWEVPRGFADAGASGVDTARRELREELNLDAESFEVIGWVDEESDQKVAIVLARVATTDDLSADADEGIGEVRAVEVAEFEAMMRSGEICDAFTLGAYAFASARGMLGT